MTRLAAPFVDPDAHGLLARAASPRRALFLDRDGVINVDHGYVHRPQDIEWVPGIFELVREASEAGFLPVVVTNQAGIARGYYDEAVFLELTRWVHSQFAERGTPLLATFFCPHHPEAGLGSYRVACECRKPAPGMLRASFARFGLSAAVSVLVGDNPSDIAAAHAAGISRALQLRRPGRQDPAEGTLVESLQEATLLLRRYPPSQVSSGL